MGYYGFGLGMKKSPRKPKKFLGKRTGLFDQQVKDDLMARHEGDNEPIEVPKPDSSSPGRITENRKNMFLKGISDNTFKHLAFLLAALVLIAVIIRLSQVFELITL